MSVTETVERDVEALLTAAEDKVAHLETALQTARRIGAAIGILMATHKMTEDAAVEMLKRASQTANRKMRDLADDLVTLGTFAD